MRLDKYLKVSRLIKRRTVANEACDNGRVTLNGKTARASAEVKPGDVIGISFGDKEVRAEVLAVQETVRKDAAGDLFRYLLCSFPTNYLYLDLCRISCQLRHGKVQ